MRAMVESERLISSISSSSTSSPNTNTTTNNNKNKYKKLKRSIGNSVKDDAVKSDALGIQTIKENSIELEGMTFQQLRTMSRNFGIPAKGSKHDLLLALKCFLDNEKDEPVSLEMRPADPESTASRRKMKNSSSEDKTQNPNLVSEDSLLQQKGRRKPPSVDGATIKVNTRTVVTKQKLSVRTEAVPDTKPSQARKKGNSSTEKEDGGFSAGVGLSGNYSEPWTVLAHKKPQQGWIPYNPRTMRPPPLADGTESVKLISWNVNGLRALLKLEGFSALQLAKRENFDVLCLQETKLQEKDVEEIKRCLIDGYDNSFWTCSVSKLGYSGTAIISRIKPLSVRYGLGIQDHDSEGRLVTMEFDTFYLICGYVPNSGDGLKRLTYRVTQWDPSLGNYVKELEKSKPVVLTGDLNCAHQEIDIFNPAGNRRSAGFTDEERQSFETNFLSRGYVDTFRKQHPGVVGYTYWAYRQRARVVNKGWRLDYFLVSESIADKVHDSYILPDVLGSDHCPIGLVLKH